MTKNRFPSNGFRVRTRHAVSIVALAGLAAGLLLTTPSATASTPAQGEARFDFSGPKKVRVLAGGIATSSVVNGQVRVEMPVTEVSTGSSRSVTRLGGTISFVRGERRQILSQLRVVSTPVQGSFVTARVGNQDSRIRAFTIAGQTEVDPQVGTMKFRGRVMRLTGDLAGRLQAKLELMEGPAAKVGKATLDSQAGFEDPYATTCSLPATSKVAGTLPVAPDPSPVDPGTTAVGDSIFWGIRSALRNYLFFLPGGQGVMQGIDGGVVVPPVAPPPAPQTPLGFSFPFADGAWNLGEEGLVDDRVVLNGSGSILLCHQTQFRILLSRPSIVINGLRARLLFDVDTNVLGEWIPTQRVKVAQLVTSEGSFSETVASVTWTNVPVILTAAGSDALRLAPFSPTFRYQAGQALEPITFTLTSTVADGRG